MATVGPYYSTEYTALYRTLPADVAVHRNKRNEKRIEYFTYTQAATGTDGDNVVLCKIPGNARVLLPELFIAFSAWTALTLLSVGWGAYTEVDGTAIAEDEDGLINDLDISLAAIGKFFGLNRYNVGATTATPHDDPTGLFSREFNSRAPVDIIASIDGAAPLATATLEGFVTYVV